MKVTWEFIYKVIRVMASMERTDYPFNCPWGQKEKHKSDFLEALKLNGIETIEVFGHFASISASVNVTKNNSQIK